MSTMETLQNTPIKPGQAKKIRFRVMRAWSFHGKSGKSLNNFKNVSTGSLDDESTDTASKNSQLRGSAVDAVDYADKKLFRSREKISMAGSRLAKGESLKEKKRSYQSQKKEVAREMMNSASDRSFVLMSDWLKVRGTLKGWTKLWCVCKPSMLVIYKSDKMKAGHWVGTILLNTCQLLQRPSKKEGFCFKLFHPLDQSIWATKGPKGETMGAFVQPLPVSYAIFRAPSENQGKCWMDGLELALRCTNLIKRTASRTNNNASELSVELISNIPSGDSSKLSSAGPADEAGEMVEEPEEVEEPEGVEPEVVLEHFSDDDDFASTGMSGSDFELAESETKPRDVAKVEETVYVCNEAEDLGQQGDTCQTEEVDDENKSLIWTLVKQVRPGMDLSKVVLPTFILEPRSFLDKLTDFYYHADLLSKAVQQETALERMKMVVKWYFSGFYKKPKGPKKPYNPIIGETFRCYWLHPGTNSRTFYVAEQISHHPPISAFHVTNRHDGFNISSCILARSKFYGNSISAVLDGVATLTFLQRGEDYLITMPYAHCKGILLGTLTMEMGGKVSIDCPKTGYCCELDFKLKPFFRNGEAANRITGCIRMGTEVLCTFEGHWDQQIYIKELTNREWVLFWDPCPVVRAQRLKRFTVPVHLQRDNESERLWQKVSQAVVEQNMHQATAEKYKLEEKQRTEAKARHQNKVEWVPSWFTLDVDSNKWIYKHVDDRPWDKMTDCKQYEKDYIIQTQTVHQVPKIKQASATRAQQTTQSYMSCGTMVTDDSFSSDNNTAELDNGTCRNTNRISNSSKSTSEQPREWRVLKQRSLSETTNDALPRCRSRPKKQLTFGKSESVVEKAAPQSGAYRQTTTGQNTKRETENMWSSCTKVSKNESRSPLKNSLEEMKSNNQSALSTAPGSRKPCDSAETPTRKRSLSPVYRTGNKQDHVTWDVKTLTSVVEMQQEMHVVLNELMVKVTSMQQQLTDADPFSQIANLPRIFKTILPFKEWILVAGVLVFQIILQWIFSH